MAARFKGKEYTFADTSPVSFSTILGLSTVDWVGTLVVRANKDNAGVVYFGGTDLTATTNRWGFLEAADGIGIDLASKYYSTGDMYWCADAGGQIIHITWIQ